MVDSRRNGRTGFVLSDARWSSRSRPHPRAESECLALRETLGVLRALALTECVEGPADRGDGGPMRVRHGSRLDRSAATAQHGAHGVVVEPLLYGGRESPQFRVDRLVRRDAAPQFRWLCCKD
jgi:hypothetical protein